MFLNTLAAKIAILFMIVCICFVDLQLAIIMTLAFLLLTINLSKIPFTRESFAVGVPVADVISEFPDTCSPDLEKDKTENLNEHLHALYMDPKIKPYEAYVRALASSEQVESASQE
jgi:hypothetical protein